MPYYFKIKHLLTWLFGCSSLLFTSCKPKNKNAFTTTTDYITTVKKLNDVVLGNNFPPMIASRNYVYANIAAYEVVAAFNKQHPTLAGQIKHLPKLNYADTVNVNYHLAALLAFCKVGEAVTFPEGSLQEYITELKTTAKKEGLSSNTIKATTAFADTIGAQILKWAKNDNYLQLRSAPKFNVNEEDGRWKPTAPMYASAIEPSWNKIRTLIMDSASQCMPARPPKFDVVNKNSVYYKALVEVKNIQDSLTDEQKTIAEFWDDNPFKMNVSGHVMFATKKFSPPGHWMNLVGEAAKAANANFAATVAAYTHCSIAIFDGFISCWDEKFRSNYVRPQTIIEKLFKPDFQPYIQTPPFPSYTSGHATISAAAAEVMSYHFGSTLSFTDSSLVEFGIAPRKIVNFRAAALEAANSRLYGGIHYRFDNEAGTASGIKVGTLALNRLKTK
jgi:membrane-associated phospholipid phosphatase